MNAEVHHVSRGEQLFFSRPLPFRRRVSVSLPLHPRNPKLQGECTELKEALECFAIRKCGDHIRASRSLRHRPVGAPP